MNLSITTRLPIVIAGTAAMLIGGNTTAAQTNALPLPPADSASAHLQVPNGFAVRLFASGLKNPRLMTIAPDGSLYVAARGTQSIVRLNDSQNIGIADKLETVATNLPDIHNMEFHDDWLYATEGTEVVRLKSTTASATLDTRENVVDLPVPSDHISRTVHFGPDGMMYVSAGSPSNIQPDNDPRHATIMRFNPDGSIPADNPYATDPNPLRRPIWADGLRNAVDFVFLPDGRLWADHNGPDLLGNDVPPEEVVVQVEKGKHYGWPYCYTPVQGVVPAGTVDVHDTRVPFDSTFTSCTQATPALFTDLAHYAPIGLTYYNPPTSVTTGFPGGYMGNLFIAYHGSWNSTQPRDCRVQMITITNGQPTAAVPFLTGFRSSDNQYCGTGYGRPAGVTVGLHGELFVSDDQNGNIYRIIYTGTSS